MKSRLSLIAFGLILLGGALIIVPSLGFTSVDANRGINVGTAETSDALLAIEQHDVTVEDQNTAEEILTIRNNAGESFSLDVNVTIHGEGLTEENGFENTVAANGGETTYTVSCEPGSGAGTTDVEVTVHTAAGESITVSGISELYSVQRDCPGPGGPGGPGRPAAEEVYDIRQESWLDDREYIFEITHNNAQNPAWEYGDGASGTGHHVRHTYASDGTYSVTLDVTIRGTEYTYTEELEVQDSGPSEDGPPAEEVYDIRQEDHLGDREYIFEITHDNAQNPEWEFGDGTTASGHYETHSYQSDGTYEMTLLVTLNGKEYIYTDTVNASTN